MPPALDELRERWGQRLQAAGAAQRSQREGATAHAAALSAATADCVVYHLHEPVVPPCLRLHGLGVLVPHDREGQFQQEVAAKHDVRDDDDRHQR
jgi:hypothetical protein